MLDGGPLAFLACSDGGSCVNSQLSECCRSCTGFLMCASSPVSKEAFLATAGPPFEALLPCTGDSGCRPIVFDMADESGLLLGTCIVGCVAFAEAYGGGGLLTGAGAGGC